MDDLRLLAVAFTAKRMGHVFFRGKELRDWRVSTQPIPSPAHASDVVQQLIQTLGPGVVVTEKTCHAGFRKGPKAKALIEAAQRLAAEHYVLDVSLPRVRNHPNKYDEALELCELYPTIHHWRPRRRRAFDSEPHRMVTFEALALAHTVLENPSTTLAAAMS